VTETTQATLQTASVVKHLLFHKALVGDDDDGSRINAYIDLVTHAEDGEHVSIKDPFHRDLAIAFELVIQHHLDPWDLDLSKFARLYLQTAKERGVDLVTAGRIILMAWEVLKLQSDRIAEKAVTAPPEETGSWEDLPQWDMTGDEWDYTARIAELPQAPIDEKIRHKGDRKVTLMELLSAFQEVHREAGERIVVQQQKLQARLSLKRQMRGRVGGMMHKEDLQAEIQETWQRILEYPAAPVPFSALHEPDALDMVQTFNGLLFLIRSQKVQASQEAFPRGEIWITPVLPEAAAVIPEEVKA
jgi:segregation and condensation protein A